MTDKPTEATQPEKEEEQIVREITFSLPKLITIAHWNIYNGARLKYNATRLFPDPSIARWEGAAALVNAGVVHIAGCDELLNALRAGKPDDYDLSYLNAAIVYIAIPMEDAVNRPLEDCLRPLSGTGKILINGVPL